MKPETGNFPHGRHHEYERTTTQCPANQQGTIREERKYDVTDDDAVINDTSWQEIENTCAYYFVKAEEEFNTLTCPLQYMDVEGPYSNTPVFAGQIVEKRVYEIWSDGSYRNHGPWIQTLNTCGYYFVGIENDWDIVECPVNMKKKTKWGYSSYGIERKRTYELWSDGSHRNHSPWVEISNDCDYYFVKQESETKKIDCPSYMKGTQTEWRYYDLWSDGSHRNATEWYRNNNSCGYKLFYLEGIYGGGFLEKNIERVESIRNEAVNGAIWFVDKNLKRSFPTDSVITEKSIYDVYSYDRDSQLLYWNAQHDFSKKFNFPRDIDNIPVRTSEENDTHGWGWKLNPNFSRVLIDWSTDKSHIYLIIKHKNGKAIPKALCFYAKVPPPPPSAGADFYKEKYNICSSNVIYENQDTGDAMYPKESKIKYNIGYEEASKLHMFYIGIVFDYF